MRWTASSRKHVAYILAVSIDGHPHVFCWFLKQTALTCGAIVIDRVTARTFHRFLHSGRTSPAIFTCGNERYEGEYVVKLRGGLERRERGLAAELYAAILAGYFGIVCPSPAVVILESDLAEAIVGQLRVDKQKTQVIQESVGLNFGTQFLVNLSIWPVDRPVPSSMKAVAAAVYAFDAFIQNPDRRFNNPNLATRNDELFVFDHELAFSFLLSIVPSSAPWVLANEDYLDQHVFSRVLKKTPAPQEFLERLSLLTDEVIQSCSNQIPPEWNSEDLAKIERHLKLMREHTAEFAEELTRRLA